MDSSCSTPSSSRSIATGNGVRGSLAGTGRGAASTLRFTDSGVPLTPRIHKGSFTSSLHFSQPSSSSATCVVPSVHNVRPGQAYISVHTLTKETLTVTVNPKTRVRDVFWACCEFLDINDDRFFGIAIRAPSEGLGGDQPRHEYFFLDPAHKLYKYAPKQPRFSSWGSCKSENRALLVLYFRVRVYIDEVRLITCERALHHYYIQLRENLLDQWGTRGTVSEERCWEMAALAVRADNGDNKAGFFRAELYFPLWVINERGLDYVRRNMPAATADLANMNQPEAMQHFCQEASRSPFALNCHLYGLRRHKMDSVDNAVIGITATGIEMCDVSSDGDRVPLRALPWGKMTRLSFDKKKLSIMGVDGMKISLYAQNENKARYLLDLCRAVHQCLLVVQHSTAGPRHILYNVTEKSVDRVSNVSNSTSGVVSDPLTSEGDRECVSSSQSVTTDQSSQRIRSRTASEVIGNKTRKDKLKISRETSKSLDIEELDSSKDNTLKAENRTCDEQTQTISVQLELLQQRLSAEKLNEKEQKDIILPPPIDTSLRPASVDSSCQTIQSGSISAPIEDFIFDTSPSFLVDNPLRLDDYMCRSRGESDATTIEPSNVSPEFHINANQFTDFCNDIPYSSSNGSRSDSVLQSNELLNEYIIQQPNSYIPYGMTSLEFDQIYQPSSSALPSSISLHDLRTNDGRPGAVGMKELTCPAKYSKEIPEKKQPEITEIRQPPCYPQALMVASTSQQLQQPPPPLRSQPSPRAHRWPTVGGVVPHELQMQNSLPNQASSESRIDSIEMWSQQPCSSSYSMESNRAPQRLYNKKPNLKQNGGISRVQSMPAHYHIPQQNGYRLPNLDSILTPTSAPHQSFQSPAPQQQQQMQPLQPLQQPSRPAPKAREPPSYERALEIQRCGVAAEARGHPSFPNPTNTPTQFAPTTADGDPLDTSRLRDLPMLRALWAESQQTPTAFTTQSMATSLNSQALVSPLPSNLMTSQVMSQRRPASCLDLSDPLHSNSVLLYQPTTKSRADYFLDSALRERNIIMPSQMSRSQQFLNNSYSYQPVLSQPTGVLDLPPPPPYPSEAPRNAPMVM